MYFRVADDAAAFVGFLLGGFKLGFDQGDHVAAGFQKRPCRMEHFFQGNKGEVQDDHSKGGAGEVFRLKRSCVDFFEVGDAGIVEEFGVELGLSHVNACHAGGPMLEEAVGEAPSRRSEVESMEPVDGEGVLFEKPFQLISASADKPGWGFKLQRRVFG